MYIVTREEHAANPWLPPAYLDGWPCSWLSTEDDNVTPSAWLARAHEEKGHAQRARRATMSSTLSNEPG